MALLGLAMGGSAWGKEKEQPGGNEKNASSQSQIEEKDLKKVIQKLVHSDEKVRKNAWDFLVQMGKPALPLLREALGAGKDEKVLKHYAGLAIAEIYFRTTIEGKKKSWPALGQSKVVKRVEKAKGPREKLVALKEHEKELDHILIQLERENTQVAGLQSLWKQGYASAHKLSQAAFLQRHPAVTYLARRHLQVQIKQLRKDLAEPTPKFEKELMRAGYLATPLLYWLEKRGWDKEKKVALEINRQVAQNYLTQVASPQYHTRRLAERGLFEMGDSALPWLAQAQTSTSAHTRFVARRLEVQVKYRIDHALWAKVGPVMKDFSRLDWREKRKVLYKLERIGGNDAIPPLRQVLATTNSKGVRLFAAQSLTRLGDRVGATYLESSKLAKLVKSTATMINLYMREGIKHLEARNFERAEKSFKKVLKVDDTNRVALYNLACVYSLWKKLDLAFKYLEKSIRAGFRDLDHIDRDADLDNLRDDPRYKVLYKLAHQLNQQDKNK